MPNRWPISSGNWSNATIWSGSLIPTASDDVYGNNQTVIIDQDVTVLSLRSSSTTGVTQGGAFIISGSRTVSASLMISNAAAASSQNGFLILTGSSSNISNVIITSVTNSYAGFNNNSNGTLNLIIPNMLHTPSGPQGVVNNLNGIINYVGNVNVPSTTWSSGFAFYNVTFGTINITGNITLGNIAGSNNGIQNQSTGNINVVGNIQAGDTSTFGINNVSIGTVTVTGNVTARGAVGINSTTAGIINVIGQLIASPSASAVSSTSTTATNIFSGPFINSGSRNAIYCYNVQMYDDVTTRYVIGVSGSNNTITLYSPDQVVGVPSGSDVRRGTIYGPGNELTGSMYVPHPNSVSVGVAVDGTVGTAIAKPEDLWNYAITSLTASNSIGQRLANTSTSASTAAITNAFG